MSPKGFQARIFAIEWHCNLWLSTSFYSLAECAAILEYCTNCVEAEYLGVPNPPPESGDDLLDEICISCETLFNTCVFNGGGPQSFD